MLAIRTESLEDRQAYKLISAVVTPRPIAWVSTRNNAGAINLAPYSSFTFISSAPPKVLVSVGPGLDALKDTLSNVSERGEFCVSSVTLEFLQAMVASSSTYGSHESEAEALGIAMRQASLIGTPFVEGAAVAMECRLDRIIEVQDREAHRLVIGTVVCFHVQPQIWQGDHIDPNGYRPVGRIGGPHYVKSGELLYAPRDSTVKR
jgi:flavin reductase (DIM6/NTAB) family NADH-FMN oxidoreductase RutF